MTMDGKATTLNQLRGYITTAESALTAFQIALEPEIDGRPDDRLLMEILDLATDAQESLLELRDLLETLHNPE